MNIVRLSLAGAAFALFAASAAAPAPAAGSGLAFDSVTKFVPSNETPPPPGNFAADFQTAANPPPADTPKMPLGLGKSMGQMQAAMSMFKTGTAERHYDAGAKHRVDHIVLNTAEITDCTARTLTTLDLKAKTYTVVSLDQPSTGSPGKPGPKATDDGSKVAIALTTRSLGDKTLEGTSAAGYKANVKTTVTKADGNSQTFDMDTTAYYSPTAQPAEYCSTFGHGATAGAGAAAAMAQYQTAMNALRDSKGNPRVTVTSSGPPLPAGKLALYELVIMNGSQHGGSFDIVTERGNVRSIGENDAVFSVPAGFTKTTS